MMRSYSRSSVVDDSEDAHNEMELLRLKRSYRVMQNDYKAYKEQTKRSITKQEALIKELEREREELDTVMSNMASEPNIEKDEKNAQTLTELASSEKEYQTLIDDERTNIRSLDVVIMEMENRIAEQRKCMGGIHQSTSKNIVASKKKGVLENRLDKSVVQFNGQMAVNSKLREDIDHYRREKGLFGGLSKRLSKKLRQTQTDITEKIKVSTQAFEQRDEAQNKMHALRERSEKDKKQHTIEMKELQRIISHDDKMKAFMLIKRNNREEYKAEEAAKKKRYQCTMDADEIFMKTFEEAFDRIKHIMDLSNVNEIVEKFVSQEESNFALFNHVNELNYEAETLQEEVNQVKMQIRTFKEQDNAVDAQHTDIVKEHETQFRGIQRGSIMTEQSMKKVNKVLDHAKHGIEKLFKHLNCDMAPILAMLGGEAGISNKNAMIYLGQIEQKTIELLHALHFQKEKKRQIDGGLTPSSAAALKKEKKDKVVPRPSPLITTLTINAPSWDDMDSDNDLDDELRPWNQLELRGRIIRELDRKANTQTFTENLQNNSDTHKTKDAKKKKVPTATLR